MSTITKKQRTGKKKTHQNFIRICWIGKNLHTIFILLRCFLFACSKEFFFSLVQMCWRKIHFKCNNTFDVDIWLTHLFQTFKATLTHNIFFPFIHSHIILIYYHFFGTFSVHILVPILIYLTHAFEHEHNIKQIRTMCVAIRTASFECGVWFGGFSKVFGMWSSFGSSCLSLRFVWLPSKIRSFGRNHSKHLLRIDFRYRILTSHYVQHICKIQQQSNVRIAYIWA